MIVKRDPNRSNSLEPTYRITTEYGDVYFTISLGHSPWYSIECYMGGELIINNRQVSFSCGGDHSGYQGADTGDDISVWILQRHKWLDGSETRPAIEWNKPFFAMPATKKAIEEILYQLVDDIFVEMSKMEYIIPQYRQQEFLKKRNAESELYSAKRKLEEVKDRVKHIIDVD